MAENVDLGQDAAVGPAVPMNDGNETLDLLQKDFDRLKAQKARPTGGVEGTTLQALCFLND